MPARGGRGGQQFRYRGVLDTTIDYPRNSWVEYTVGTDRLGFIAPSRIPANSPAPDQTNTLWIEFVSSVITGPQGAKGNTGNATILLYIRASSAPSLPADGAWDGTTLTLPSGYSAITPTGTDTLFALVAELDSTAQTFTAKTHFQAQGEIGPEGPASTVPGPQGMIGNTGLGFVLLYQRNANTPSLPADGAWDGTTLTLPAGWARQDPDPTSSDNLWALIATLDSENNTFNPIEIFSARGIPGPQGTAAPQMRVRYSTDGTTFHDTPPAGFITHLEVSTDGGANYVTLPLLRGPQGTAGTAGADSTVPGPAGNGYAILYRRQTSRPPLPTTGAWNGQTITVPTGWTENDPNPSSTDTLWALLAELDSVNDEFHARVIFADSDGSGGGGGTEGLIALYDIDFANFATTIGGSHDLDANEFSDYILRWLAIDGNAIRFELTATGESRGTEASALTVGIGAVGTDNQEVYNRTNTNAFDINVVGTVESGATTLGARFIASGSHSFEVRDISVRVSIVSNASGFGFYREFDGTDLDITAGSDRTDSLTTYSQAYIDALNLYLNVPQHTASVQVVATATPSSSTAGTLSIRVGVRTEDYSSDSTDAIEVSFTEDINADYLPLGFVWSATGVNYTLTDIQYRITLEAVSQKTRRLIDDEDDGTGLDAFSGIALRLEYPDGAGVDWDSQAPIITTADPSVISYDHTTGWYTAESELELTHEGIAGHPNLHIRLVGVSLATSTNRRVSFEIEGGANITLISSDNGFAQSAGTYNYGLTSAGVARSIGNDGFTRTIPEGTRFRIRFTSNPVAGTPAGAQQWESRGFRFNATLAGGVPRTEVGIKSGIVKWFNGDGTEIADILDQDGFRGVYRGGIVRRLARIYAEFSSENVIVQPTISVDDAGVLTLPTGWTEDRTELRDDTKVVGECLVLVYFEGNHTITEAISEVSGRHILSTIAGELYDVLSADAIPTNLYTTYWDPVQAANAEEGVDLCRLGFYDGSDNELTATDAQKDYQSDARGKLNIDEISSHIADIRDANSNFSSVIYIRVQTTKVQRSESVNTTDATTVGDVNNLLARVELGTNQADWVKRSPTGRPMMLVDNDEHVFTIDNMDSERVFTATEITLLAGTSSRPSWLRLGDGNNFPQVILRTDGLFFDFNSTTGRFDTSFNPIGYQIVGHARYSSTHDRNFDLLISDAYREDDIGGNDHGWSGDYVVKVRNAALGAMLTLRRIPDTPGTAYESFFGAASSDLIQGHIRHPNEIGNSGGGSGATVSTDLTDMPDASEVGDSDNDKRALVLDHGNADYELRRVLLGALKSSLERTGSGSDSNPYLTGIERNLLEDINRVITGSAHIATAFRQRVSRSPSAVFTDGVARDFADLLYWNSDIEVLGRDFVIEVDDTTRTFTGAHVDTSGETARYACRNDGNYYIFYELNNGNYEHIIVNASTGAEVAHIQSPNTVRLTSVHIPTTHPTELFLTAYTTTDITRLTTSHYTVSDTPGDTDFTLFPANVHYTQHEISALLNSHGYDTVPSAASIIQNISYDQRPNGNWFAYILLNNVQHMSSATHTGAHDTVLIRRAITDIGSNFAAGDYDEDYFFSLGYHQRVTGANVIDDGEIIWMVQSDRLFEYERAEQFSYDLGDVPRIRGADVHRVLTVDALATGYELHDALVGILGDSLENSSGLGTVDDPFVYNLSARLRAELLRLEQNPLAHPTDDVRENARVRSTQIWSDGTSRNMVSALLWDDELEIMDADRNFQDDGAMVRQFGGFTGVVRHFTRNAGNYYVSQGLAVHVCGAATGASVGNHNFTNAIRGLSIEEARETDLYVLEHVSDSNVRITNVTVSATDGDNTFSRHTNHTVPVADIRALMTSNGYVPVAFIGGSDEGVVGIARIGDYMYYLMNEARKIHSGGGNTLDTIIIRQSVTGHGSSISYGSFDSDFFISLNFRDEVHSLLPFNNAAGYWIADQFYLTEFVSSALDTTEIIGMPERLLPADRGKALILNSTNTGYTLEPVFEQGVTYLANGQTGLYDPIGQISPDNANTHILTFNASHHRERNNGNSVITLLQSPFPAFVSTNMDNYSNISLQNDEVFQLDPGDYDIDFNIIIPDASHDANDDPISIYFKQIISGTDRDIEEFTADAYDLGEGHNWRGKVTLLDFPVDGTEYFYFQLENNADTSVNVAYNLTIRRVV